MKRLTILIMFLASLLMISCGNSNTLRVSAPRSAAGRVDGNYLIISGLGGEEGSEIADADRGNARLSARRAAILDAQRNTLRYLGIAEKIKRGSVEYERVEGVVKGSQVVGEDWQGDNQYRLTLRVPLNGQGSLAEGLNYKKIIVHP